MPLILLGALVVGYFVFQVSKAVAQGRQPLNVVNGVKFYGEYSNGAYLTLDSQSQLPNREQLVAWLSNPAVSPEFSRAYTRDTNKFWIFLNGQWLADDRSQIENDK